MGSWLQCKHIKCSYPITKKYKLKLCLVVSNEKRGYFSAKGAIIIEIRSYIFQQLTHNLCITKHEKDKNRRDTNPWIIAQDTRINFFQLIYCLRRTLFRLSRLSQKKLTCQGIFFFFGFCVTFNLCHHGLLVPFIFLTNITPRYVYSNLIFLVECWAMKHTFDSKILSQGYLQNLKVRKFMLQKISQLPPPSKKWWSITKLPESDWNIAICKCFADHNLPYFVQPCRPIIFLLSFVFSPQKLKYFSKGLSDFQVNSGVLVRPRFYELRKKFRKGQRTFVLLCVFVRINSQSPWHSNYQTKT